MSEGRQSKNDANRARLLEGSLHLGVARFGTPLVVGMVLHTAFNLVDMFMIGQLDNAGAALAALGVCDMVAAVATIVSNGVSTAAVAIIARHLGSGFLTGVRRAAWQSSLIVISLAAVFGALGLGGAEFIVRGVMQTKGQAAELATEYLRIVLGGCASIFLLLHVTGVLRALGHAKTAAVLLVGGNALNILLNVFLIFGTGPAPWFFAWGQPVARAFDIPPMGVIGAAWASLFGRLLPVAIGIWILVRRRGGPKFHWVYLRPMKKELSALLRLAWPNSAQLVLRLGLVLFLIALVNGHYTTDSDQSTMTAYSICMRLETLILFVGLGWGAAACSFIGTNLGAGQVARAQQAGWVAAAYNLGLTLALSVAYVTWADDLIGVFDDDPIVVRVAYQYLRIVALSYGFMGVGLVLSQAITGAGATLTALWVDGSVIVGFIVPLSYAVVVVLGLDRPALWSAIAAGNTAAALAFIVVYARGRFLKQVIA